MNSLNPVARVHQQITDGLADHDVKLTKSEQEDRVTSLLAKVGLSPQVAHMYPHELSGGMKQRVVIAIAISLRPKVIIADELDQRARCRRSAPGDGDAQGYSVRDRRLGHPGGA